MTARRNEIMSESFTADADLSAKQFYAVTPSSTGAALANLAGESITGVLGLLQNEPVSGSEAHVGMVGVYPGKLGGTVALYDTVTCDADGKLVRARPGDFIMGVALQAGATGDECPIFLCPQFNPFDMYFTAEDALTAGYAVQVDETAGEVDLPTGSTGCIGIVLASASAGAQVRVRTFGVCQAVIGTSGVTCGDPLKAESGGKLVAAGTGAHLGYALATIAADATGTIFFRGGGSI